MRTSFVAVEGEAEQRIAAAQDSGFHLVEHDLRRHQDVEGELGRQTEEEATTSFDLQRGPLIRGRLLRLGEEEHALLMTMHQWNPLRPNNSFHVLHLVARSRASIIKSQSP